LLLLSLCSGFSASQQHWTSQAHGGAATTAVSEGQNLCEHPEGGGPDPNFPFGDSAAVEFGALGSPQADEAEPKPVVMMGNWLTDLPGQLGKPALTLDAVAKGGSFPENSKSCECCCFKSQNPGQGAEHLMAIDAGFPSPGKTFSTKANLVCAVAPLAISTMEAPWSREVMDEAEG